MNIKILSELLKSSGGQELVAYLADEIKELEKEEKERLEKILIEPHTPTEELVALKVIARTKDKVKKILENLIALKDYKGREQESDEGQ